MSPKQEESRSPFQRLLSVCLTLLGCAICLTIALSLLAQIWPWLVGIGLVVGGLIVWFRIAAARRRDW